MSRFFCFVGIFSAVCILPVQVRAEEPVKAASSSEPALSFVRATPDATGEQPEVCLSFNQDLRASDLEHLVAAVRSVPEAKMQGRIDGKRFCLGGLAFRTHYTLQLSTAFASASGEHLAKPLTVNVSFGARPSHVAVTGNGFIIPGHATTGVNIESVNVKSVRVHVFRAQAQINYPGTGMGTYQSALDLTQTTMSRWSLAELTANRLQEVWHGTMALNTASDRTVSTAFPLQDVAGKDKPGLFLVTVEDETVPVSRSAVERAVAASQGHPLQDADDAGISEDTAVHWANLSDLGMTMLRGSDGLTVRVRSLEHATPDDGVTLTLIAQSGAVLGTAQTNTEGEAHFDEALLRGKMAQSPALLLAQKDKDFSFLHFDTSWFDFSDRHAEGSANMAVAGYEDGTRALIQPERDIYRPGEDIHMLVLLRDRAGKALKNVQPVLILYRPDGTKDRTLVLRGDQDGGYAVTLPLARSAVTGAWKAEVRLDPTLEPAGTTEFTVDSFVPQTIAVKFSPPESVSAGEEVKIPGDVHFLYGAPGAGLKADGHYMMTADQSPVSGLKGDWTFGLQNEDIPAGNNDIDSVTADDQGHAVLSFTPSLPEGLNRPLALTVRAGFVDPAGRRVGQNFTIPVKRSMPLIGLQIADTPTGGDGKRDVPVNVAVFAPDNKPLPGVKLHWNVARVNRIYNWSYTPGNGWTYTSHVVDVPVAGGDTRTDAKGSVTFSPSLDWGDYRLVVSDAGGAAASSREFYVGWQERSTDSRTPDRLPLSVKNDHIAPDGTTLMHIGGGFAGRADITLATDHVLSTRTVDVPKEGLDVPLTATPEWHSGVYVLATLYRPLSGPGSAGVRPHDPVRAVGLTWVGTDQSAHHLNIGLDAPATALPRTHMVLPLSVSQSGKAPVRRAHVAVAAVDQGILGLTGFKPLDMFDALYGQPRLGIDMLDNYGSLLLTDTKIGQIRSGGDVGGGSDALAPPVYTTRSVALFDGPVALDAAGHGQVAFDVPDFDGQLHLMATAWTEDAVGNSQGDVIIRDPIFPDLSLPRFMAPGDTAQVLASLINTAAPKGRYGVELTTQGPVHLAGQTHFEAELAPGARQEVRVPLTADKGLVGLTGIGHISMVVKRLDGPEAERSKPLITRDWSVGIRYGHIPVTTVSSEALPPGVKHSFTSSVFAGFRPDSTTVTLGLSAVDGIDSAALLQSFPTALWGSSDSLAAQARGLLQVKNPALLGTGETRESITAKINTVIEVLFNRQSASGLIGQWSQNDGSSLDESSDFIADFLIRAKAAGYKVPEDRLNLLLDMIETQQLTPAAAEREMPASDEDQQDTDAKTDANGGTGSLLNARSYAAYVLARAGRLHPDIVQKLASALVARQKEKGNSILIGADAAQNSADAVPLAFGHIAVAMVMGDVPDHAGETSPDRLLDMAVESLGVRQWGRPGPFDLYYWIYVYNLGALAALTAEAHDDAHTLELIRRFRELSVGPSELEDETKTAFLEAAMALNKDVKGRSAKFDGKPFAEPFSLPAARKLSLQALGKSVVVENTGVKPLYTTVTRYGVPDGQVEAETHGLTLSMTGYRMNGDAFDLKTMKQDDRFIVCFEGTAEERGDYSAILTQLLPAGWEIESKITADQGQSEEEDTPDNQTQHPYRFLGELTDLTATSATDDRFTAAFRFTTLSGYEAGRGFRVAYIVRAITPGHFILPEAVVRGQTRPSLMARTASGEVEITPR